MKNHWIDRNSVYFVKLDDYDYHVFLAESVASALNYMEGLIGSDKLESLLEEGLNIQRINNDLPARYFVDLR